MKWFKFYGQDWLTDIKIMALSIEDRLCFITLLCLASSSDEPGTINGCTEEAVLRLTQLDNDQHQKAVGCFKRFEDLEMIGVDGKKIHLCQWDKRQEQNLTGAERTARWRKNKTDPENEGLNTCVTESRHTCDPRIDKIRIQYRDEKARTEVLAPLPEKELPPTLEDYLRDNFEEEYVDENLVYRRDGKAVSLKTIKKEYSKQYPASPERLHKPRGEEFGFDHDTFLMKLKNSSRKVEKIIAFVWGERGYRFQNYDQWRARMGQDVKYARSLEGYEPWQVEEVITALNKEEQELNYKWSMSTLSKRIANTTLK